MNSLTLFFILLFSTSSFAASLVFVDDFEGSYSSAWDDNVDGFRESPSVVSSALDGGVGPVSGSGMVQVNWNGTVAWNEAPHWSEICNPP